MWMASTLIWFWQSWDWEIITDLFQIKRFDTVSLASTERFLFWCFSEERSYHERQFLLLDIREAPTPQNDQKHLNNLSTDINE